MKRQLMEVLACPVCKQHPLDLVVAKENEEGIIEGRLSCPRCGNEYEIRHAIPDMIPPDR
jgi:uncharacterized protein YbaR (Trm112 family)